MEPQLWVHGLTPSVVAACCCALGERVNKSISEPKLNGKILIKGKPLTLCFQTVFLFISQLLFDF